MDWLKKNWMPIACGVVALVAIGLGVWAIMGFKDVQAQANTIAAVATTLEGLQRGGANLKAIKDAEEYYKIANRDTTAASDRAIEKNKREPLRGDVFPTPQTPKSPIEFRDDYREAMRRLPQDLKAERAPSGDMVDRILSRMEDKARREANVNTVGDQMHIPKPPEIRKIETVVPVAAAPTVGPNRGDDRGPSRGPSGDDRGPSRGDDDRGPSRGDDRGPGLNLPTLAARSTAAPAGAESAIKPKTREELMPKAKQIATYDTARRVRMYVDDNSLEMHPMCDPTFVGSPEDIDMWGAQVLYWIEKDIVDALARVNEQAAATLPEDQRWVAYLPVKHLVSLTTSDYLSGGGADSGGGGGRATPVAILHRNGQRAGRPVAVPVSFGDANTAFTARSRSPKYEVVHVALNLVVDAKDLPKVLVELCKQNFITPLDVQYRNVDVINAREAGYVYGSGPVIDVDIICETLFFASIYNDKIMPEKVKKILSGEIVEGANKR